MSARAERYAVLVLGRYAQGWHEYHVTYNKDHAIDVARNNLRAGARAAVVQGRGTPGHPTPPDEVQVWRGIADGYDAGKLLGGVSEQAPPDVEVVKR